MLRSLAQATVGIIDDDEAVRDSLVALLTSTGLSVQAYASAQEFLESREASRVGCLIVDCQMPDMDGLTLVDGLAARGRRVPVIVISGNCDNTTSQRARRAGAVAILEKPFSEKILFAAIRRALG